MNSKRKYIVEKHIKSNKCSGTKALKAIKAPKLTCSLCQKVFTRATHKRRHEETVHASEIAIGMPEKSDEFKNTDTATDDVVIADSKAEEGENVSETEVLLETTGFGSDFEIEEVQSEVSDLASLSMVSLSLIQGAS